MKRLVVIPGDPIYKYHKKGEIKKRYWNPCEIFDEVHILSLCKKDVEPEKVQALAGRAKLYIHAQGKPNIITLARYYSKVTEFIRGLAPDLIRSHGPWHAGSIGVYASKKLGVPCINSIHNDIDAMRRFDKRVLLRLVKPLEYYTLSNASAVICVSNYLHRYARARRATSTITNYNRVYLAQFRREIPRENRRGVNILTVTRLDPQKYPDCLLRSIVHLDATLKIIGQGSRASYLHNLARELGVADRVEFIEMVPNHEIHQHYHSADIFALATHYEGFCIPILEAMASGLPVVACDTEPIPEILGGTGVVVQKDPSAFEQALKGLIDDPGRRTALAEAALKRAGALDGEIMENREAEIFEAFMSGATEKISRIFSDEFRFIS